MTIEAIYADGVLRPLAALDLPAGTPVYLQLFAEVTAEAELTTDETMAAAPQPIKRQDLTVDKEISVASDVQSSPPVAPLQAEFPLGFLNELRTLKKPVAAILLLLVLAGGALRLYDLDWDQGKGYHPDERWITMVTASMSWPDSIGQLFDVKRSTLNPYYDAVDHHTRNFAYGTLPVYLTKFTSWLIGQLSDVWQHYDHLPLIGRALSGLLDTGAILLVFLLGRRLWGDRCALLGAAFYAFTVLSIQHSHFYTTDVTLNFFILLTIFFATDIVRLTTLRGGIMSGLLTGAAAGMALASKFSAAPILAIIPVALALRWWRRPLRDDGDRPPPITLAQMAQIAAASIAGFFALHFLFQPYAYLDFSGLLASIQEQNRIIVTGEGDVPYTQQYIGTTPYLYFIVQIVRWALGTPLGLAAMAGWALFIYMAVKRRSVGAILLLTWMLPYFLITGRFYAKFLRYVLPLLPFLCLMASYFLLNLRRHLARFFGPDAAAPRWIATALIAFVTASTVFWALAFAHIYTAPHTANQAAVWMNKNIPAGSTLLKEHWEEGIGGLNPTFRVPPAVPELPMYERDETRKLATLKKLLPEGDYLFFYSSRLYGTIPRLPERYPMSRHYYELLLGGKLGYELVHFSASYPQLMGVAITEDTFTRPDLPVPAPLASYKPALITINGGYADESFTAYDHPLVMVFKRVRAVTPDEIDAALRPWLRPSAAK